MKDNAFFQGCAPVTVEQVLTAREKRVARIQALVLEPSHTIISFKLNIPGKVKQYPLARNAFEIGIACIESQLKRSNITIIHFEKACELTGNEAFFLVEKDSMQIKKQTIAIEDSHPLGRLFDIDVTDGTGQNITGAEVGRPERSCLICGGPVWVCARSRRHSADELALQTAKMIEDHLISAFAETIATCATRALLYEVSVTPKPGLVDRLGNGAHSDMDFFTFIDSATTLSPYFRDITIRAIRSLT